MMYNVSGFGSGSVTFGSMVSSANEFSGGVLVGGLLLAVFFVLLVSLKRYEFMESFAVASWITFVVSAVLVAGGFLNFQFTLMLLVICAVATFLLYMDKKGS